MIYLFVIVLVLQSIFWWFLRPPTMSLEWIFELRFLKFLIFALLVWIISGKSK